MAEETRNLTQAQEEEQLAEQARIRREKLAKLIGEGNNPYEKTRYEVTADFAPFRPQRAAANLYHPPRRGRRSLCRV